ncbi:MAG TPA: protein-L-isoaspartate(D-aspartate) O-methyltransferase [Gemmatimonadota bacterium]|nr:protein-L-isoaspartate(D-aspartate) O-methyltransferase [Gemmatimonadota bacterium]
MRAILIGLTVLSVAAGLSAPAVRGQGAGADEGRGRAEERSRMVREQIAARGIESRRVLDAMLDVPRHLFVPSQHRNSAYADHPLPIGEGQTISQPYIVALMTELLELRPEDMVLEIGTGSGYQAAVASHLADSVFTIEIIPSLAESAARRLDRLEYGNVVARQGDGYYGWPEHAPFDAIVVTAAAGHIPPPLIDQLAPGGRMAIPVGGPFQLQHLVLVEKAADGTVTTRNILPVRFVPLVGH